MKTHLDFRSAARAVARATSVHVHVIDGDWALSLWHAGVRDGVTREHVQPAGRILAIGLRDDAGVLWLLINRALPHDSHARALLPLAIVMAAPALFTIAARAAAGVRVQLAVLYRAGNYTIVEQAPRVGIWPDVLNGRRDGGVR